MSDAYIGKMYSFAEQPCGCYQEVIMGEVLHTLCPMHGKLKLATDPISTTTTQPIATTFTIPNMANLDISRLNAAVDRQLEYAKRSMQAELDKNIGKPIVRDILRGAPGSEAYDVPRVSAYVEMTRQTDKDTYQVVVSFEIDGLTIKSNIGPNNVDSEAVAIDLIENGGLQVVRINGNE